MDIDQACYYWLIDRGVIEEDARNKPRPDEGLVKLHWATYSQIESGEAIAALLMMLWKSLASQSGQTTVALDPNLLKMKQNTTPASKFYNWNILAKELRKFGLNLDRSQKQKLIEKQDFEGLKKILYSLLEFDIPGKGGQLLSDLQVN